MHQLGLTPVGANTFYPEGCSDRYDFRRCSLLFALLAEVFAAPMLPVKGAEIAGDSCGSGKGVVDGA